MPKSIDEIKEAVKEVAKRYDVERVYLFGSYARGDQREDSDIDLHVYLGDKIGAKYFGFYVDLEEKLNTKVGLTTIAPEEFPKTRFKNTIMENILAEEILIYERT